MNILEITHQDKRDLAAWETHPSLPQAVKLLDGTVVTVRAIRPDDAPRLQALFDRLSQDTIYLRFLSHRKALSKQQAAHLANVNYVTQMALVATREQEDIVGVARYAATNPDQPDRAEAAIVVDDQYQGHGLGALLLKWLMAHAKTHSIRVFHATVHPRNTRVLRFIEDSDLPTEKTLSAGAWEIRVNLESGPSLETQS